MLKILFKSSPVRDLAKELRIEIMYLPAYSPNLNPIERLWKFMKREVMANRYFPDVETFQRELMLFLRGIRKHRTFLLLSLTIFISSNPEFSNTIGIRRQLKTKLDKRRSNDKEKE